jgi:hypothetical protein
MKDTSASKHEDETPMSCWFTKNDEDSSQDSLDSRPTVRGDFRTTIQAMGRADVSPVNTYHKGNF